MALNQSTEQAKPQSLSQTLYSANVRATGGREGSALSDDKKLNVLLSTPTGLGGAGGDGTNPEQLFAAGYAACFIGALKFVAGQQSITIPADVFVDAKVDIGPVGNGFGLAVKLAIGLPGIEHEVATKLVEVAHQVCPYSNATRGNIEVDVVLIETGVAR